MTRRICFVAYVCLLSFVDVRPARAQESFFDRLGFDKLQLVSLSVGAGRIFPSQVESAALYALSADYGEIARSWRVLFGVSYWESRYTDEVVQRFIDNLNLSLVDPTRDATILRSRISLYDVTFSTEARYVPTYSGEIKPYLGVGLGAHVMNAEGTLIDGTLVERSLDNIAAGLFVTAGLSLKIVSHFGVEGGARADLLSGFRSTQFRAGAAYYFGHIRGARAPARAPETPPPSL